MILDPKRLYLAQTDTTVGFLSQDAQRLALVKKRSPSKPFLICVDSFATLKAFARVPKRFKRVVRYSKKTTFIYPNKRAVRVVRDEEHLQFLKRFSWMYSSSANESGKGFEQEFAMEKAEIVIFTSKGFFEGKPSSLIKINKRRVKKVR